MRVAITGATGLIGTRLVGRLRDRGDEVVAVSRDPDGARERLGPLADSVAWDPIAGPVPEAALAGADAIVHLAGEPIAQRWTSAVKERIRASRVVGTRNLVAGIAAASSRPGVIVHASAVGYYGDRGDALLDESSSPGPDDDFLAAVCVGWEHAASGAQELGVRVVSIRTGVVLDRSGGALTKMLPPFKAGVGGPVAGGRQYMPWIHLEDLTGLYLAAVDGGQEWSGPVNSCAPEPVTNAEFSRALGRALHRPAVMPVPSFALRLLFGEMAAVITASQRVVPKRALELGYRFRHDRLDDALGDAVGRRVPETG